MRRTMYRTALLFFAFAACYALNGNAQNSTTVKITFEDHIKPIFREHCTSCHNTSDKDSGLALDSYGGVLEGGSGGKSVDEGNVDGSRLYSLITHKAQPKMPPERDKIPEPQIELIKKWIEQGMPENSGSAIKKPKANVAMLTTGAAGRPSGPPPMPERMLKQPPIYTPRSAAVSAIAASPWAPLVAIGGQEQVVLYHSETAQLVGILPFPEGEPQSIRFSRDGGLLLVGGGRHSHSGFAVLYDIKTGERVTRVGDELDIVMDADISDDNRMIALAGPQKLVRIYATATGEKLFEMKKHTDWIYSVRFSPDGILLATGDRSNGLVVWEAQTGRLYLDLVGHKGEVRSLAWRQDSGALISSSMDGTVKFWEMNEGKLIKSFDAHAGGVAAVANCNDGTIVTTGKDRKVKVWDSAGNAAGELPQLSEAGLEAAITVDGKHVVAGDWMGKVMLWERAKPTNQVELLSNPPTLQMLLSNHEAQLAKRESQRATTNATYSSIQAQLASLQKQAALEEASLNQTSAALTTVSQQAVQARSDMEVQAKKIAELEASLAEAKKSHASKAAEFASAEATLKEMMSKKEGLEKQKEATVNALKPLSESTEQAKVAVQSAQAEFEATKKLIDATRKEIEAFNEYQRKLAQKDAELKAQIEILAQQVSQAEEQSQKEKVTSESLAKNLEKLQGDLQRLTKQVQEEESKRKLVEEARAAQEKQALTLKSKLEQVQAEAAAAAEQKALFEKAFAGSNK